MKTLFFFAVCFAIVAGLFFSAIKNYDTKVDNLVSALQPVSDFKSPKSKCTSKNGLPDPICNHPVINKNLTIKQVCNKSFRTGSIRPPTSYTNPLKIQKMKDYGYAPVTSLFELDHIMPIYALGDPRSPDNLWPQYWSLNVNGFEAGARTKDKLEVFSHKLLCSGKTDMKGIEKCFTDWISCYRDWIGELPKYDPALLGGGEERVE